MDIKPFSRWGGLCLIVLAGAVSAQQAEPGMEEMSAEEAALMAAFQARPR